MWTEAIGGLALAASVGNGYLIYKGSDRASKRTADVQEKANATDGFVSLTQEQRKELEDQRLRTRAAEDSALQARKAAEETKDLLERCQLQMQRIVVGYGELWEWAVKCEQHRTDPPPRPPVTVLFGEIGRRRVEEDEENDG